MFVSSCFRRVLTRTTIRHFNLNNVGERTLCDKTVDTSHQPDEQKQLKRVLNSQVGSNDDVFTDWAKAVYPVNVDNQLDQGIRSFRPKIDPRETSVIFFPGQGVQYVGMAEKVLDCPNVQEMFAIAKRILGYDLLDVCLNGPQEKLNRTEFCQPAIFVCSLAALEKLRSDNEKAVSNCIATSGFSIGEFAALVFAGAMSFEDALRLIKIRAEAMQAASELVPSGLMTILYGADGRVKFACQAATEWCIRKGVHEDFAVCSVSNYLFPHCKVIGGHSEALNFIELNARDFGIKRCIRLPVSGAFHTNLMRPAEAVFREALKKVNLVRPLIAVYSNVDARTYNSEVSLREKLGRQICAPVKFEQIVHTIYERAPDSHYPFTFECGPGHTITTILDKVNGRARRQAVNISA